MSLFFRQKKLPRPLENIYSFQELKMKILQMFQDYTEMPLSEVGLSESVHESQEEHRRIISQCVRNCNSGNRGVRETVLELIDTLKYTTQKIKDGKWTTYKVNGCYVGVQYYK